MEPTKQPQQVSLLFFENIDHPLSSRGQGKVCDEIEFGSAVKIQLIRIVKPGTEAHQQLKQLKTITDKEGQFKTLEIFAKDLQNPSSQYSLILNAKQISDTKSLNHDVLISLPQDVFTNRLILRGEYNKLTLCIYGDTLTESEIETHCPLFNVPSFELSLLQENQEKEKEENKIKAIKEQQEAIEIERLESTKKIASNIFEKNNYHISNELIQPKFLIEKHEQKDKQQLVTEINQIVGIINQFSEQSEEEKKQQLHLYRKNLETLAKDISNLFQFSEEKLQDIANFQRGVSVYRDIPPSVVKICLDALKGSPSEFVRGLDLSLQLMNSYDHAQEFIENDGLIKILSILSQDETELIFSSIKLKALEALNAGLSFKQGSQSFFDLFIQKNESECIAEEIKENLELKQGDSKEEEDDGDKNNYDDEQEDHKNYDEQDNSEPEKRKRKKRSSRNNEHIDDDEDYPQKEQQSIRKERRESESRSRSRRRDKKKKDRKKEEKRDAHSKKRPKSSRSREKRKFKKSHKQSDSKYKQSSSQSPSERSNSNGKKRRKRERSGSKHHTHKSSGRKEKGGDRAPLKSQSARERSQSKISHKGEKREIINEEKLMRRSRSNIVQEEQLIEEEFGDSLIESKIQRGYQRVLFEMSRNSDNEEYIRASQQVLHKSLLYLYCRRLEEKVTNNLLSQQQPLASSSSSISKQQSTKEYSSQTIKQNETAQQIANYLNLLLRVLKEQTLLNAQLAAGWTFEDVTSKNFASDKKRQILKFSVLKDVVNADLPTLTNENIRMFHQMKLLPSILVAIFIYQNFIAKTSQQMKESSYFPQVFCACYDVIVHLLECKGNVMLLSKNKDVLKVLIQALEQLSSIQFNNSNANDTQNINDIIMNESNYSNYFKSNNYINTNQLNYQKVLNDSKQIEDNKQNLTQQQLNAIKIAIYSKQLSSVLKYMLQLVNVMNQIYSKIMANELDSELISLLSQISLLSSKSSLSKIALNKILINNFAIDAIFQLFSVNQTEHLVNKQVEITLLSEILYNVLLFDEGLLTVLYSNQIITNLVQISDILEKNSQLFDSSREIKKYALLLRNYMQPMEILIDEQKKGLQYLASDLKKRSSFAEEDEEKNIKIQLEKQLSLEIPISTKEFRDDFLKFGNLDDTNQNLIFIEVSLKILSILLSYNKNIFITFYEIGIMSTLDHLMKHISSVIQFFARKSIESESMLLSIQNKSKIIQQYSQVLHKVLSIIQYRFNYRSGFQPASKNLNKNGNNIGNNNSSNPNANNNSTSNSINNSNSSNELGQKHDQLFVQQLEVLVSIYSNMYQINQNRQEQQYSYNDIHKQQQIISQILNIMSYLLFEQSNDNYNSQQKCQLRISTLFSIISSRIYHHINNRPPLINLLANIITIAQLYQKENSNSSSYHNSNRDNYNYNSYQQQQQLLLNSTPFVLQALSSTSEDSSKQQASDQMSEFNEEQIEQQQQSISLFETVITFSINFASKLIQREMTFFLQATLDFYHYPTTHSLVTRLTEEITKNATILKNSIPSKNDLKVNYYYPINCDNVQQQEGTEGRKEREDILESVHCLSRLCSSLRQCCKNGGFKTDFLYQHGDEELIKCLQLLDSLEEYQLMRYKEILQKETDQMRSQCCELRMEILQVVLLLVDHEIGCSNFNNSFKLNDSNKNYSCLVEDIPQISHLQELFSNINKYSIQIPLLLLKRISTGNAISSNSNQQEEIIEEPDFVDEENSHASQATSNENVKKDEMGIQEASNNNNNTNPSNTKSNSESIILLQNTLNHSLQSQITHVSLVSLQLLTAAAKNPVGQMIILYSDYVYYAYKSNPALKLSTLTCQIFLELLSTNPIQINQELILLFELFTQYLYFILQLAINPSTKQLIISEKRKNAIKTLLIDDANAFDILGEQESCANSLERLFGLFSTSLGTFENQLKNQMPDQSSDLKQSLEVQCNKCSLLLNYLRLYAQDKSRASSKDDSVPELPGEIRIPETCLAAAKRERDKQEEKQVLDEENWLLNRSNNVSMMLLRHLEHLSFSIITEGSDTERIKGWQLSRFYNIFQEQRQSKILNLYEPYQASNLSICDADYEILPMKPFHTCHDAKDNLGVVARVKKDKNRLIEGLTQKALAQQNQFDSNSISTFYPVYEKENASLVQINEVIHLHKCKHIQEQNQTIVRNPLTKHVLETLKVPQRLKISNNVTIPNQIGQSPAAIANAQLQAMASLVQATKPANNNQSVNSNQFSNQGNQPNQANNNFVVPNAVNNYPQNNQANNNYPSSAQNQFAPNQINNYPQAIPNNYQNNPQYPLNPKVQDISSQIPRKAGQGNNPVQLSQSAINAPPPQTSFPIPQQQQQQQQNPINPIIPQQQQISQNQQSIRSTQIIPQTYQQKQHISNLPQMPVYNQMQTHESMVLDQQISQAEIPLRNNKPINFPIANFQNQPLQQSQGVTPQQQLIPMGGIPQQQLQQQQQQQGSQQQSILGQQQQGIVGQQSQQQQGQSSIGNLNNQIHHQRQQISQNIPPGNLENRQYPPYQMGNNNINPPLYMPPHNNQNYMKNPISPYGMNQSQQSQQHPYNRSNQQNYYGLPQNNTIQQTPYIPQGQSQHHSTSHISPQPITNSYYQQGPPPILQGMPQNIRQNLPPSVPHNQYGQSLPPPPPPPSVLPPPPPQQQIPVGNNLGLTTEEKKLFQEKIDEIMVLQKNKGDPRSVRRIQAIFSEHPKLMDIISKSKQQQSQYQ